MRCRYCAAGLAGRLCTRNHVNPLDWRLTFCGDCGAPLQRVSGAGFSSRPYLVAGGLWLSTVMLMSLVWLARGLAPGIVFGMIVVVGALGGYLGWQVLPPMAQHVLTILVRGVWIIVRSVVRLMLRLMALITRRLGTRLKGRR